MRGSPDIDANDDLLNWFWETVDDEITRQRLFSSPFIAKYAELENNPREWAQWAREEFARIKEKEAALLESELVRVPKGGRNE